MSWQSSFVEVNRKSPSTWRNVHVMGRTEAAAERARAFGGVRGSATALMERLDALTDPERVEDAAMLAGWRAKYENEITERMKSSWWRRMGRKRENCADVPHVMVDGVHRTPREKNENFLVWG